MIESRFWKIDLLNHSEKLKKRKEIKGGVRNPK